jgi:pimeloyl-ACP methyl ester carboxylesterase
MPDAQHFLILRGLVREARHWGNFPAIFQGRLKHGVHTLDLPGVGTEHQRDCPRRIEGIMEDLRERFVRLRQQHPGTWRIFAVSLGGMVAQAWAHAHPEDFSGVVLCNSSAANLSKPWERMQVGVWGTVGKIIVSNRDKRERHILSMTTHLPPDERERVAAEWARYAHESPVSVRNGLTQLFAATRYAAPASLPVPVLVLSSAGDELCNPVCSDALARRYRAPLQVHPKAGHDLPLEDGAWVADQVANWLHVPA